LPGWLAGRVGSKSQGGKDVQTGVELLRSLIDGGDCSYSGSLRHRSVREGIHDELLQQCGVFLVSVKLIIMSHKNGISARHAEEQLEKIQNLLATGGAESA
jgi:hypothetical protein